MKEDSLKLIEQLALQLENEQTKNIQYQNQLAKMSISPQSQNELNLITQQLDLSFELDRLYHLINGHVIKKINNVEDWVEPDDDRLKVFSEYGAKVIFNYTLFYINKNTLLSNFNIDEINEKMYTFGIELTDFIYSAYEYIFYYPSPEKLFEDYKILIDKYPNRFRFLFNEDGTINENELYEKCLQWSKEELTLKLNHLPMIILAITDSIHATMLRAEGGKERESLRKYINMHLSQNIEGQLEKPKAGLLKL